MTDKQTNCATPAKDYHSLVESPSPLSTFLNGGYITWYLPV